MSESDETVVPEEVVGPTEEELKKEVVEEEKESAPEFEEEAPASVDV